MLRQRAGVGKWALTISDILIVIFTYFLSHVIRGLLDTGISGLDIYISRFLRSFPAILPIYFITFYMNNLKLEEFPLDRNEFHMRTLVSFTLGFLASIFMLYLLKLFFQSRFMLFIFYIIAVPLLYGIREVLSRKVPPIRVLIVGSSRQSEEFFEKFSKTTFTGIERIEWKGKTQSIARIKEFLKNSHVDWVVALGKDYREWMKICTDLGITLSIPLERVVKQPVFFATLERIGDISILSFHRGSQKHLELFVKYTLDKILAFIFLIMAFPLFVVVPIIIKLTSKGPVIFKQVRVGLNGKKFVFYKFRTMYHGADRMRKILMDFNEMDRVVFKMKNDPRITPVGRILRRFSLDELPQLWNVLKGDMSLVGPRPPLPEEVEEYELWERRRLSMKPGLTCLWQIRGRNEIKFSEWIKMDLEYIDNWSLLLDMKILLKTIPAVFSGRGAY